MRKFFTQFVNNKSEDANQVLGIFELNINNYKENLAIFYEFLYDENLGATLAYKSGTLKWQTHTKFSNNSVIKDSHIN